MDWTSGWELLSESFCSVIPLPIAERQNREGRQIVWKDKPIVFGRSPPDAEQNYTHAHHAE